MLMLMLMLMLPLPLLGFCVSRLIPAGSWSSRCARLCVFVCRQRPERGGAR
jgi:hypothetical protein